VRYRAATRHSAYRLQFGPDGASLMRPRERIATIIEDMMQQAGGRRRRRCHARAITVSLRWLMIEPPSAFHDP